MRASELTEGRELAGRRVPWVCSRESSVFLATEGSGDAVTVRVASRRMGADPSAIFAHDANLGFPLDDPAWRQLFSRHGVRASGYRDMAALTRDLEAGSIACSYLPAANYFYLRRVPTYAPIGSAIYAAERTPSLKSVLVVGKESAIAGIDDLHGKRLGYAHRYCTSSYFAPALLVREHGYRIDELFAALIEVAPYQGQIDAVLSGTVDATMVEEDVWLRQTENSETMMVLARKDHLPTPLMVVDRNAPEAFREELRELLLSHYPPVAASTLFAGFAPYQREQVEEFFAQAADAVPAQPSGA
jgi:phosphonate transport system substrate-binding protein